ncbi:MAG: hypothetical protein ABIU09_11745, partial [Pyrinomonadaceae bacterium]
MKNLIIYSLFVVILSICLGETAYAQDKKPSSSPASAAAGAPQFEEWSDEFGGYKLDEKKWERFTFEGASGGKLDVRDGEVQIRSIAKTRAGIRTKEAFSGDRFAVEGRVAKVGAAYPDPGSNSSTLGF